MAPEPDDDDADAIDPLLGQPRMVADPRISVTQAAVVLDKTPAQVYWMIQLGQLQRRGDPNTRYGIALSDVHELRDKGEPIPIRQAARSLSCSVSTVLELVADGKLPLVAGTKSLVYPADVKAIAADVAVLPIRRPVGLSGYIDTAAAAKRLGLSESYVRQMAAEEKILGVFQHGRWWFDSAHIDMIHRARQARRLRAIPQRRA
jgi:hypothetical protein